ncbi:mite group 2 allergen Gly d 2.02 [Aedes aegypti]|uniref:ML domain-containing protein n=1 Tax=Aedes aegypti TaxID=7159 RepID=A0A1S4EZF1_AEDAE|nr:mite group 2 allergen Gly d 2.02 [Aedes aegypti]
MFKFLILFAIVPAMAFAAVNFRVCSNKAPTPTTLTVNDCSGDNCVLVAKKPLYALASGIVSSVNSKTATTRIVARFLGMDLGFRTPPELTNACNGGILGGCPIVAGRAFNYVLVDDSLEVPAVNMPVEIEVSLTGDGGVALGCVRFNARIAKR